MAPVWKRLNRCFWIWVHPVIFRRRFALLCLIMAVLCLAFLHLGALSLDKDKRDFYYIDDYDYYDYYDYYSIYRRSYYASTPASQHNTSGELPARLCDKDERQHHMNRQCGGPKVRRKLADRIGPGLDESKAYNRFVVDDKHQIIFCIIPKNACSSWKALMISRSGKYQLNTLMKNMEILHNNKVLEDAGLRWLDDLKIDEIRWRLEKYYMFTILRHPYTRLYSAWKDKFVKAYNTYGWKYAKLIQLLYPDTPTDAAGDVFLSFERFAEMLTAEYNLEWPTSSQLKGFQNDRHWVEQVSLCHLCNIHYDYVARLDTLETDTPHLLKAMNASELPILNTASLEGNQDHSLSDTKYIDFSGRNVTFEEAFQSLSPEVANALWKRYAADFAVLGYQKGHTENTCGWSPGEDPDFCC